MTNKRTLPIYSVKGNNYEIGYRIGKRFKDQITDVLKKSGRIRVLKRLENRNSRLRKLIELGKAYYPQYMKEMEGIADGSELSPTDIFLRNFHYDYPLEGCTTIVFKSYDRIILAHNEENSRENLSNCYLLKVHPDGSTPFISHCYPGMLPGNSFGYNANGIVITNNSMLIPDLRIGSPRHLSDRDALEAKDLDDLIKRLLFIERASGGNYNIVSQKEDRAINIETSAQMHAITEVKDNFVHTNHFVSKELNHLTKELPLLRSSMSRYEIGSKLLSKTKEKTPQAALDILSNLEAKPYSILRIDRRMRVQALFTAVFDASDDGVTMKVYEPKPEMQEKDAFIKTTLDDLKI